MPAPAKLVEPSPLAGNAVGTRLVRLDGQSKVDGAEIFGADEVPAGALVVRAIRSPFPRARFRFGDLDAFVAEHPGIDRVLTAKDIPGENRYGVIPRFADQPVFAEVEARFRGEAVAAVVGDAETIATLDCTSFPIAWEELPALTTIASALAPEAERIHPNRENNVLVRGRVVRGDVEKALTESDVVVEGEYETGFIEHAYIEPEAGFARRVNDQIEVQACTQAPYMDRADIAQILGSLPKAVRIIPTAVGGGFGAKLDLSVQPFVALAAWHLGQPVRMVYSRTESIISTTKRHPSHIRLRAGATRDGKLTAMDFAADFNTGRLLLLGANGRGAGSRPCLGALPRAALSRADPGSAHQSGAGGGFPRIWRAANRDRTGTVVRRSRRPAGHRPPGIPHPECARQCDSDGNRAGARRGRGDSRLFRGVATSVDRRARRSCRLQCPSQRPGSAGVGVAGMWYGCGNTSLPNPSTIRVGLKANGRIALHQGAVDIGQGSNTIVTQICADALGAPIDRFDLVSGDTSITPDCGKTSASRQTFVTGKAAYMAGIELRRAILHLAGACDYAVIDFRAGGSQCQGRGQAAHLSLHDLPLDKHGYVLTAEATFDPPTSPLDENGQGNPYAVYGFGAHMAEIAVDMELGTVRVLKVTAAHDVGRAINPTLIEGQIEGGAAQGLGMALMEEFFPGKGENLHDYLIPSAGDMPPVESILIEDPSSVGPYGAKGIGEQAVIPTAPAILNAIHDAIGVRIRRLPATPDRVRAAIVAQTEQKRA